MVCWYPLCYAFSLQLIYWKSIFFFHVSASHKQTTLLTLYNCCIIILWLLDMFFRIKSRWQQFAFEGVAIDSKLLSECFNLLLHFSRRIFLLLFMHMCDYCYKNFSELWNKGVGLMILLRKEASRETKGGWVFWNRTCWLDMS